jgi:hypothetical protein
MNWLVTMTYQIDTHTKTGNKMKTFLLAIKIQDLNSSSKAFAAVTLKDGENADEACVMLAHGYQGEKYDADNNCFGNDELKICPDQVKPMSDDEFGMFKRLGLGRTFKSLEELEALGDMNEVNEYLQMEEV